MTARRRALERRVKQRRGLIAQVARRFYVRLRRKQRLANDLVKSIARSERERGHSWSRGVGRRGKG